MRRDLKDLTRRIVYRGGEVLSGNSALQPTPLIIAAYYGYEEIMKLLLALKPVSIAKERTLPL